jgi:dihydropteroate synthase
MDSEMMSMNVIISGVELVGPQVMGILNCTPDSFSDGGQYMVQDQAILQARQMLADGAKIIDIGGESTRPGAPPVDVDEELRRVIGPIEAIKSEFGCLVSIDTLKAEVMIAAVRAGADMINDVNALRSPGALEAAAATDAAICLMHMQGEPQTMQSSPCYRSVVDDVLNFFEERITACKEAGIARSRLILDPGFGFGKTLDHNYQLLRELDAFKTLGLPILAGLSRKSMIGNLLGRSVDDRLAGSLAGACIAAMNGAQILRVHDVKETADALAVIRKTMGIVE